MEPLSTSFKREAAPFKVTPEEVLRFITGGMDMPGDEWRCEFPELAKFSDAAHKRWERETGGGIRAYSSDPMVCSLSSAMHHWCYLPLMRAALRSSEARP